MNAEQATENAPTTKARVFVGLGCEQPKAKKGLSHCSGDGVSKGTARIQSLRNPNL